MHSLQIDKWKLVKYLSTITKVHENEILIRESYLGKLKIIGTFLAASIPIIISIITTFHNLQK
jgi:hypothetical protein